MKVKCGCDESKILKRIYTLIESNIEEFEKDLEYADSYECDIPKEKIESFRERQMGRCMHSYAVKNAIDGLLDGTFPIEPTDG